MNIDFEICEKPMPFNKDAVKFLYEKGSIMFLWLRETKNMYDYDKHKDVKKITNKIVTINIHPNITIVGHDFFSDIRFRDTELIGYCPLEFPSQCQISI